MTPVSNQCDAVKAGKFELAVRTELWSRGWTIADLARAIKRPRPSVSVAINHPHRFAQIRKQIRQTLELAA